jgi:ADP-heptose:LPS heptosyltransferase
VTTVLALRALGLGDALTGIPALRGLRRAFPGARLLLAAPAGVGTWLRDLGVVDRVVATSGLGPIPWAEPPPDVAVNLHGCGPESHRVLRALRPGRLVAFAAPAVGHSDGPPWPAQAHEVDRWCRLSRWVGGPCSAEDLRLPARTRGTHVVVHPGAASGSRRWPIDRWAQVAAHLADEGHPVVVTGVPDEASLCAELAAAHPGIEDACGEHTLAGLAELAGSARMVLCGDTGIAHLATAFGTPSVLLFGPTAPDRWGPRIDPGLHTVLWRPRDGDPRGDPHAEAVDPRLARITPEEVIVAAAALLGGLSRPRARPA